MKHNQVNYLPNKNLPKRIFRSEDVKKVKLENYYNIAGDVTGDGSGGGGGGANNFYLEQDPDIYTPIYVVTGFYLAVAIIAPLLVRRGPDRGVIITSIWIGVFCMWLLWFTVYVSQINPLFGPCIKNTTLAFIAHSWGPRRHTPVPGVRDDRSGNTVRYGLSRTGTAP
ncbi:hypothetical protein ABMA28_014801 [Loxostege sticticalis]|uniref:Uncharacterized protein n=1 Tax=Loxostege sticticalis TaxID=481309 RepID=A0ABD0TCB0_LOXSC